MMLNLGMYMNMMQLKRRRRREKVVYLLEME
jgi:hypothetical protein